MEYQLPAPGLLFKQNCQVRKVVTIRFRQKGLPDIGYEVPEVNRKVRYLWYPLWQDWAKYATIIDD